MKRIFKNILSLSVMFAIGTSAFAQDVEQKVQDLLSKMTLEEKIGQMNQINHFTLDERTANMIGDDIIDLFVGGIIERTGGDKESVKTMPRADKLQILKKAADTQFETTVLTSVREGKVGSVLNSIDAKTINQLQKAAMEESRLGIPLIIGRDVIHGFKTIFPIPLGQAASFNPEIAKQGARVAAIEARHSGINWTFAPMLDISRDARWGRIAESLGEDPYLASQLGAAMVEGFQGNGDLKDPHALAACVKHFAGYGAAEGGRDYNSTSISPRLLRNVYLAPFKAAIDAGAATVMTSFNDNDGVVASGDDELLRDILRDEWKFDGFVISDWESMKEMIMHGYAKDLKDVARISSNAGLDMEMVSGTYNTYLLELVKEGKVSESVINESATNVLRVKFRMGLFDNPYADESKVAPYYAPEHLQAARQAAIESAVLLKNDNNTLPIAAGKKIAIIGPMADATHDQLGTWIFDGEKDRTVTPIGALKTKEFKNIKYIYEAGLDFSRDTDTSKFAKAKKAALASDVAVLFLGEESFLSGEAHSLSNINLIGKQSELIQAIKSTGKPVIVVIMAGRPLTIERDLPYADAVLYSFHPGTMGGPALLDLLLGKETPSGKLPATFVREVGQIPMYYNHNNTGRPTTQTPLTLDLIGREPGQTSLGNTSFYLDSGSNPLYPFGYGLSYTTFEYSDIKVSNSTMLINGELKISVTLKNTGNRKATEVAQLYVRDLIGSITRPVKELKGFQRVTLDAGESKVVEFTIKSSDLAFYGKDMKKKAEAGDFKVWIGGDSNATLEADFTLK